ncbi:Protein R09H10.3 b [Aphelenchoides avenae]|nr:Protein R09H10.3 b [Aphelenchus avenae]
MAVVGGAAQPSMRPLLILSAVIFAGVIIALSIGSAAQGTTMTPVPPNSISSHVLDTAIGKPAAAVAIIAFKWNADRAKWIEIGTTSTDSQGRVAIVHPGVPLETGEYKVQFRTKGYFEAQNRKTFYPFIEVVFEVDNATQHYHVPLTLSNYGLD